NEGIPNSLIEAMATSKPVVASAVDGIPELVQDGKTGLLFESNDIEQLTGALARLIDDPSLRAQYGAAGRQRIENEFDLRRQAELYRQLYRSLLERNGRHWLNRF